MTPTWNARPARNSAGLSSGVLHPASGHGWTPDFEWLEVAWPGWASSCPTLCSQDSLECDKGSHL
eukprot:13357347-Alexandrium_andersonii.AAC.1